MRSFVLLGHVDHGKSTLGGRILINTKFSTDRDVEKAITEAENNNMKSWWLAYLLDDDIEKIKGKTYQHTIVPITYNDQSLQLIDVPGHQKYVKEMILGASKANIAVLLVSAKKGELESGLKGQTYEHLLLARGMGITSIIVVVNKMDHESVNWDDNIFKSVSDKIIKLCKRVKYKNIQTVAISAYNNVNIDKLLNSITTIPCISDTPTIYQNINKITVKCILVNINNLISSGYKCILHTDNITVDCTIEEIIGKVPFITKRDVTAKLVLSLSEYCDISSNIILRNGDKTIALGKIL